MADADDQPVNKHSGMKLRDGEIPRRFEKSHCLGERAYYQSLRNYEKDYVGNVEERGGERVYNNGAEQFTALQGKRVDSLSMSGVKTNHV